MLGSRAHGRGSRRSLRHAGMRNQYIELANISGRCTSPNSRLNMVFE